jgi:hypothetical protein
MGGRVEWKEGREGRKGRKEVGEKEGKEVAITYH